MAQIRSVVSSIANALSGQVGSLLEPLHEPCKDSPPCLGIFADCVRQLIVLQSQRSKSCVLFFLDSIRVRLGVHDPMWHLYMTFRSTYFAPLLLSESCVIS